MSLRIFNTLSSRKEVFDPSPGNRAGMYVCGVTVYDYCHVGHARSAVVFDTIFRYLEHLEFDVTYVRNFTDIDDKIINRSLEEKVSWQEVTKKYIGLMFLSFLFLEFKNSVFGHFWFFQMCFVEKVLGFRTHTMTCRKRKKLDCVKSFSFLLLELSIKDLILKYLILPPVNALITF